MLSDSKHIFKTPAFKNPEKQRIAKLLHTILLILLPIILTVSPLLIILNPIGNIITILVGGGLVLMCLILFFLIRSGHITAASIIISLGLFVGITASLYVFGGIRNIAGYFLVILVAAILLGAKATIIFAFLCTGSTTLFFIIQGSLSKAEVIPPPLMELVMVITTLWLATLLLRFAMVSIAAGFNEAQQMEAALNKAKDQLEENVKQRTSELANANKALQKEIIERKQMEERLLQAQKMEAIGRLAGGVAHDFNNLLTAIIGYTDLLLLNLMADDPSKTKLLEIKKASNRAADLTRRLLAFSRKQIMQPRIFNLNKVINETQKMLRRIIGEDIELITKLNPNIANIKADPIQISQIVINMAVNSRDAMPQGGIFAISTQNTILDESSKDIIPEVKPGKYVEMEISDNGTGMEKDIQSHIFEPFFTTKEKDKGTGLGLASMYGIVTQSGGAINLISEPGQGTTFRLYFPETIEEPEKPAEHDMTSLRETGNETVLLVEDDEIVRHFIEKVLQDAGYKVLVATNSQEALKYCKNKSQPIELMVTDVVIPGGMSGVGLSKKVKELCPDVQVLYISGYTDENIMQHGIVKPEVHFLQKPFSHDTLLLMVRKILNLYHYQKNHKS